MYDISGFENNARVLEMETNGLSYWLEVNGLSLEEAALIQPMYSSPEFDFIIKLAMVAFFLVVAFVFCALLWLVVPIERYFR